MTNTNQRRLLLWSISILAIIGAFSVSPISQDTSYHHFADQVTLLSIPNALNVLSNLPFLIVGIFGVVAIKKNKSLLDGRYIPAMVFSIGVALVAFGSGYYHYHPTNETLVWDRLPMTIAFMGFYASVLTVFISKSSGEKILPWLVSAGGLSVAYWAISESLGLGDLRWYALVQFLPIILTLVILIFFEEKNVSKKELYLVVLWYGLAKVLEIMDFHIFESIDFISGHSLKHIAAAVASYYSIKWLLNPNKK